MQTERLIVPKRVHWNQTSLAQRLIGEDIPTVNDGVFDNRLLVIDDEMAICRIVQRTAESLGFEAVVTDNPEVFTRTVRLWHPTVIIMDLKMPTIDGIQLLRILAGERYDGHVVVSSGSDQRVLEAAMRLGQERGLRMGGLLAKPIRVDKLREMLVSFRHVSKDALSTDLADAIATNALFLEYQPKFDCGRGKYTGVEALVRWRHPQLGMIRPDEFIVLAETTGLISSLTDRVVAAAVRQAGLWHADNMLLEVAINISARDIEDLSLPDRLQQHCFDNGVDPDAIILELTETGAMREAVQMMDVLTRLRLKGFRLSIDDFGTGYSSLVQLERMPFSEVKIDRSFVAHMIENSGCRVIAEIVIDLARKLGLKSVAEGVENQATLDALVKSGCDMAQGYFLSRPIAGEKIAPFVRGHLAAPAPLDRTGGDDNTAPVG